MNDNQKKILIGVGILASVIIVIIVIKLSGGPSCITTTKLAELKTDMSPTLSSDKKLLINYDANFEWQTGEKEKVTNYAALSPSDDVEVKDNSVISKVPCSTLTLDKTAKDNQISITKFTLDLQVPGLEGKKCTVTKTVSYDSSVNHLKCDQQLSGLPCLEDPTKPDSVVVGKLNFKLLELEIDEHGDTTFKKQTSECNLAAQRPKK